MTKTVKDKFSKAFWIANSVELLERAAYYGVFIVITLYLSRIIGFGDIEAGIIAGLFSAGLYFLPTFSGAYADKIGFKNSLLLAFGLLTVGYAGLAIFPTLLEGQGLVEYLQKTVIDGKEQPDIIYKGLRESSMRYYLVPVLLFIMVGGSFIKSVISATIAKETTEANRARGFSVFYMMVNIGAFSGKTIVKPLREEMGNIGLINLNYFSAGMTLLAFILIYLFFKSAQHQGEGKSFKEIWDALIKVLTNGRLVALILIVSGFWIVQHQLYATMPKYVLRMAGEGASPSWYANVNPLVVVLTVAWITQILRHKTPLFSMTIGMFIMPISALAMASGNWLSADIDESFISPRFLEFFSLQSPKGEEGLYLGFSHLHSFVSSVIGFTMSGFLLDRYCPDPKLPEFANDHEAWLEASANAHYIWYYFVAISLAAAIGLIIYGKVIKAKDAEKLKLEVEK